MIRSIFFLGIIMMFTFSSNAQVKDLYDPYANAIADIDSIVAVSKIQGKFVLIQAGGNWCSWCKEFYKVATNDPKIDSVISVGFNVYHLNFSKENMNEQAFAKLGFPQRFGFPTFIILNGEGKILHTQNSEYLEDGFKSYNKNKVQSFLEMWTPHSLDPKVYGM